MIHFDFSEEQRMMREAIRSFGRKEIVPHLRAMDEGKRIPDGIIGTLAGMGLLGMTVSKERGGLEADAVTVGLAAEELARADISCAIPTFFLVQAAWGAVLDKYGSDEVRNDVLPKVTKGQTFLGIAATEPDAGSDLAGMRTTARLSGSGYVLNGEKMFISGIDEVLNQLPGGGGYVTLAKTDPALGAKGMSLFYVAAERAANMSYTLLDDWGRRGISTGGFKMDDVVVPRSRLIGEENRGFTIAMEGFNFARAVISVVCCGAAMSSLEKAMEYIKIRKAFGQPVGKFEGVQFKLAEHWAKLEAARLLGYKALWAYEREQRLDPSVPRESPRLCAEAKLLAAPSAFEAVNDAIQWFGAFGYTVECPLDLALKGIRSYFWAEGSLEIMKIIVARELLGKEFVAYR